MINYILGPVDTDSISICKPDMSPFTKEEQQNILDELNKLDGEHIQWKHDGVYDVCIILKAKNYILWDGKKLKIKGSALKSGTKEQALKDFMNEIIWAIINETNNYTEIYHKYIDEALNIKDIKRWCSRKSITEAVMNSERKNETKVKDVIAGTEYVRGDRIYVFFRDEEKLELAERFDGCYSKERMLGKLFETSKVFDSVIPKGTFQNLTLKKNKKLLDGIINKNIHT